MTELNEILQIESGDPYKKQVDELLKLLIDEADCTEPYLISPNVENCSNNYRNQNRENEKYGNEFYDKKIKYKFI